MDESTKRAIKKAILTLRKLLEREDIPAVLKQHGIFPDGRRVPAEKLALLDDSGKKRRERLEAIIDREVQAVGGDQRSGVQRYCREVVFTYLNRLIALRCMEVRGLIDECVKTRDDYAGRSLRHHRFLREQAGTQFDQEDTDSLKALLRTVFRELQDDIRILFDPDDEYSIIMPSLQALRECIRALNEDIPEDAFKEPELLGWVYQYFQTEEKDRVFEEVRTKKKKIEGDDIVPATSLYTERYMVDYLVQNSLGAIWMEMYPDSKPSSERSESICENWSYFVKDQDLKPREPRPVKSLAFLDPACGSGHFLLVAFDLFTQMYEEEARLASEGKIPKEWVAPKEEIATTILESNLHGIDIDLRSVQLSYLVLYLKLREHQKSVGTPKSLPVRVNLVAADASLLNTPEFLSWCEERFKGKTYVLNIIKGIVGRLHNLSEIGSLAKPEENLKELISREKERLISAWKKGTEPKQLPLFKEMVGQASSLPTQQELPFDKITDDQFWQDVLKQVTDALDEYYQQSAERGDTRVQIFAHEAIRGFKFLEFCNKRYDVVATNPPYMGKNKLAHHYRSDLVKLYPQSGRDLYGAFIERCIDLTRSFCRTAMVTMHGFMFIPTFRNLREYILENVRIKKIAHLGNNAFAEMGDHAPAVLFVLKPVPNKAIVNNEIGTFHRIVNITDKAEGLLKKINIFHCKQELFQKVPCCPFVYWLPTTIIALFDEPTFSEVAKSVVGLQTGDIPRRVRFFWEINNLNRWKRYYKGGDSVQFYGEYPNVIDWSEQSLKAYKTSDSARWQGYEFFGRKGLAFLLSGSRFSVRYLPPNFIFDVSGPCIFPNSEEDELYLLGYLNSRMTTYLLSVLNPSMHFLITDIKRLPFRKPNSSHAKAVSAITVKCVQIKKNLLSQGIRDIEFNTSALEVDKMRKAEDFFNLQNKIRIHRDKEDLEMLVLCLCKAEVDRQIFNLYNIFESDLEHILDEQGTPIGWHPIIEGYDTIPEADECEIPKEIIEYLQKHERIKPSPEELAKIKSLLCTLYGAGPSAKVEDVVEEENNLPLPPFTKGGESDDAEEEAETLIGKRIPIPTETFLEELSVKMEIHPISIYWLLKEMREKEGLVCWPECKRYVEDYFTVMILRMLGFCWPKQVEAGEPVPDWADQDGIIPITGYTGEKTLHERIRDRIGAEFGEDRIADIEAEFADILYNAACKEAEIKGKTPPRKKITLTQWLEKEFFKRHTSQFKKRPIAWHLTSPSGTFQVLLFYHKISLDMLKNLKNRYLAKVQSYYETLLERARRGEPVPGGLTAGKLSDIEGELEDFANRLDKVMALPYEPLIDDGVRVNIAPLQKLGVLASPVLATKDVDRAIADRNRWREDDKEQDTVWKLS